MLLSLSRLEVALNVRVRVRLQQRGRTALAAQRDAGQAGKAFAVERNPGLAPRGPGLLGRVGQLVEPHRPLVDDLAEGRGDEARDDQAHALLLFAALESDDGR